MPKRLLRDYTDSDKFDIDHLSAEAERLFVRLIQKADDFGKFYGDATRVRSYCFPINDPPLAFVQKWINELAKLKLIQIYETDGKRCLLIHNFGQRTRIMSSKFPDPASIDKDLRIKMTADGGQMTAGCQHDVSRVRPEAEAHSEAHSEAEALLPLLAAEGHGKLDVEEDLPMPPPLAPICATSPPPTPSAPPPAPNPAPPTPTKAPKFPKRPRQPDPIWDTVAELFFGGTVAEPDATHVGKIVKGLKAHGATPAEIKRRRDLYLFRWPNVSCTADALLKHWSHLGAPDPPKVFKNAFTGQMFQETRK